MMRNLIQGPCNMFDKKQQHLDHCFSEGTFFKWEDTYKEIVQSTHTMHDEKSGKVKTLIDKKVFYDTRERL